MDALVLPSLRDNRGVRTRAGGSAAFAADTGHRVRSCRPASRTSQIDGVAVSSFRRATTWRSPKMPCASLRQNRPLASEPWRGRTDKQRLDQIHTGAAFRSWMVDLADTLQGRGKKLRRRSNRHRRLAADPNEPGRALGASGSQFRHGRSRQREPASGIAAADAAIVTACGRIPHAVASGPSSFDRRAAVAGPAPHARKCLPFPGKAAPSPRAERILGQRGRGSATALDRTTARPTDPARTPPPPHSVRAS